MAIKIPDNSNEIIQRSKTDVQRELPNSNPFLKNSWLGAIISSLSNRVFDFYLQLKEAFRQSIPDTATATILERWAAIWGIIRLAATKATGSVVATGTATTNIPISTLFADSSGIVYESTAAATITSNNISVSSITRSGNTATATTSTDHGMASNVAPTISGANEGEYNVNNAEIQVTGPKTFTYQVSGAPASPATGTIQADYTSIQVPVECQTFGVDGNQESDSILSLQSPISGVDNGTYVDADTLSGGTDQETDSDLRIRMLERIQNPVAHFNVAEITAKAKEVGGVTRVFVQEVTPAVGQVTVYFMRDNDADPIPSAPDVTNVKNKLLEIKPANTSDANLIVSAPTGVDVDFTFTDLTPNTSTMQTAITANLQQFFDENTDVGVNIDQDLYRAAIANTVDTVTGDTVETFTLSSPSGDVTITTGEIGVLNNITYP